MWGFLLHFLKSFTWTSLYNKCIVPTYLKMSAGLEVWHWILESSQDFLLFKSEVFSLASNTYSSLLVGARWETMESSAKLVSWVLPKERSISCFAREQTSHKRHFHNLTSRCFATHVINPSSFPLLDARHLEQDVFHLLHNGSQVTPKRATPPRLLNKWKGMGCCCGLCCHSEAATSSP